MPHSLPNRDPDEGDAGADRGLVSKLPNKKGGRDVRRRKQRGTATSQSLPKDASATNVSVV